MTSGKLAAAFAVGYIILASLFDERVANIIGLVGIAAAIAIHQLNQKANNQQADKERQVQEFQRISDNLRDTREERYLAYLEECDVLGNRPISREEWMDGDDQRIEKQGLKMSGLDSAC